MSSIVELFEVGAVLDTVPEAFLKYGIKFVFCIIAIIAGVSLGKFLRKKKDKRG